MPQKLKSKHSQPLRCLCLLVFGEEKNPYILRPNSYLRRTYHHQSKFFLSMYTHPHSKELVVSPFFVNSMKMGRGRAPCCAKVSLNKGYWMPEEDMRLITYIQKYGHGNWRALPRLAGLARCGKSCRLRWINYLRPDIKRGNLSKEEEDTIIKLHELLGGRWSKIASYLPGRTDNEIKNVWNTHLKKTMMPKEHKSPEDPLSSTSSITTISLLFSDEGESKIEKEQAEKNMESPKEAVEPDFNSWDMQQVPPTISLCTSTSDVGLKDDNDHLFDLPEITIEPSEIWNMIDGGDQNSTTKSSSGYENDSWLTYLEKELDLREGECKFDLREGECKFDHMLMEDGDPAASYFHELQFSSFL